MVNHRVDKFELPQNTIEATVIGVFYLVDGKIAEWTDYISDPEASDGQGEAGHLDVGGCRSRRSLEPSRYGVISTMWSLKRPPS